MLTLKDRAKWRSANAAVHDICGSDDKLELDITRRKTSLEKGVGGPLLAKLPVTSP